MVSPATALQAPPPDQPACSPLDAQPPDSPGKGGVVAAVRFLTRTLKHGAHGGRFLVLLQRQAQLVPEAARLLSGGVGHNAPVDALRQFLPLKSRARDLERSLTAALLKAVFTPLAHEDVRALSVSMTRLLESIVDVAALPLRLPRSTEAALWDASNCCAKAVCSAIATLPGGKRMAAHTAEITVRARKAEFLLRDCEMELVARERDAIWLLKRRQASRALRSLFRRYREMANALEFAVLRNG